jgi:hypothetical protein
MRLSLALVLVVQLLTSLVVTNYAQEEEEESDRNLLRGHGRGPFLKDIGTIQVVTMGKTLVSLSNAHPLLRINASKT